MGGIRYRPGKKRGFSMPLAEWLRGTLSDWFGGDALIAGLLQLDAARRRCADHQRGARDCDRFLESLVAGESWTRPFPANECDGGPAL